MEAKQLITKRTGLGAGLGAGFALLLSTGPVGIVLGGIIGGALANLPSPQKRGEITKERQEQYEAYMASTASPADLRELAAHYRAAGVEHYAVMLEKRAELRELDPKVGEARRNMFRLAMTSDEPAEIEKLADSFAQVAATSAAAKCREHAEAVRAAHLAGKSAKPMQDEKAIAAFGDKLAKAIYHFKPGSPQAASAAANFLRARGMTPTPELIKQTIALCVDEMKGPSAPQAQAPAGEPAAAAPPEDEAVAVDEEPVARGPAVEEPPADAACPPGGGTDPAPVESSPAVEEV